MKTNELRIGNFVNCALNEQIRIPESTVRRVDAMLPFGEIIVDLKPTDSFTIKCPIVHCTGIPLTEEWLVKFGFKKVIGWYINVREHADGLFDSLELADNNDKAENQFYVYFRNMRIETDDYVLLRKDLKYVHELQNLYFALTGEELKVNEQIKT